MQGRLIIFEGPDFSGKTTQAKLLAETLKEKGYDVLLTKEPGGSSIGPQVRSMMLSDEDVQLDPMSELMLVMADRAQHIREVLQPALEQGKIVICDRFIDSSLAYQGFGKGLVDVRKDYDLLKEMLLWAQCSIDRDLTIYMNVDYEVAQERSNSRDRKDKMEELGEKFHRRVQKGFMEASFYQSPWAKLLVPQNSAIEPAKQLILGKTMSVIDGE